MATAARDSAAATAARDSAAAAHDLAAATAAAHDLAAATAAARDSASVAPVFTDEGELAAAAAAPGGEAGDDPKAAGGLVGWLAELVAAWQAVTWVPAKSGVGHRLLGELVSWLVVVAEE